MLNRENTARTAGVISVGVPAPDPSESATRHRGIFRLIPPAIYGVQHSDKRNVAPFPFRLSCRTASVRTSHEAFDL
jgi:hypothetical protein